MFVAGLNYSGIQVQVLSSVLCSPSLMHIEAVHASSSSRAVHKIIITTMFTAMKLWHNAYSLHLTVTKKEQKQVGKKF